MFCTKCGTQVEDGLDFCTNCGNDLRNEQQMGYPEAPAVKRGTGSTYVQPIDQEYISDESAPVRVKQMGLFGYLGLMILQLIPIVGFIFTAIFAMDKTRKDRSAYCTAWLIIVVLMLAGAIALMALKTDMVLAIINVVMENVG